MRRLTTVCTLILGTLVPAGAKAQLPIPSVSIVGGVTQWDLSGTGASPIGALRVNLPLLFVMGEGSVGVFRAHESAGTNTYIIPEAQLQWELFPLLVKPYLGIGAGFFRAVAGPAPHSNTFTASGSAGVRVGVPLIGAGFRAELRVRGVGTSFGGSAAEWTAGLTW